MALDMELCEPHYMLRALRVFPTPRFKPTSCSSSLEQVTAPHDTQSRNNKLTYFRWLAGLNK